VNNDANISGVTVAYDTDRFVFTSSTTGAASSVALTAVGANADQLGISTGTATAGTGGANDYDFSIAVDGTTSAQINADATLSGAGASVTVAYDGSQFLITSDSTGVSSTIANATAIGSQVASLGFTTGTATQGATTGGNTSAYDFSISLNGTTSGTISLDSGTYADKDAVAADLSNSGVIDLREDSLDRDIDDLDEDQTRLDRRIEAYQERLTSQFIAMEAIVRSLQDSSAFLESTLDNLLNSNNN